MNHDTNSNAGVTGGDPDETRFFAHDLGEEPAETAQTESLFETYEPRSVSAILAHRNAILESDAAEAAAIILDGVEPQHFDDVETQAVAVGDGPESERPFTHIRVHRTTTLAKVFSPGAQFIYALITVTLLGGLIGLAASLQTPVLVLLSGILSPILLPICIWKWIRWLDSDPYYYRLLSSLGEDACNLLNYRLFWKRSP